MTITVTQEDIEYGKRRNCHKCPVAIATKRGFPECNRIEAGISIRIFKGKTTIAKFSTRSRVIEFMGLFDCGCVVHPFTFELV